MGNSEQLHDLGLHVLHPKNVGYFYTQRLTTSVATTQTIFIHFRVALGSQDTMLKILFVDMFPLPLQPTEILHHLDYEGYTKLNVEKPYLVVTHTGNGFVELSESELQTCLRSILFPPELWWPYIWPSIPLVFMPYMWRIM